MKLLTSFYAPSPLVPKGKSMLCFWYSRTHHPPSHTFGKNLENYLETGKADRDSENGMVLNDSFVTFISSYFQAKMMANIANESDVKTFKTMSSAKYAHTDAFVAAEFKLGQEASGLTISGSSSKESKQHGQLHDGQRLAPCWTNRNRREKSWESSLTLSIGGKYFVKRPRATFV